MQRQTQRLEMRTDEESHFLRAQFSSSWRSWRRAPLHHSRGLCSKHTAKWQWHQQPSPQGSPDHQGVYTVFCSHREILRKSSIKNIRCSTFDGTVPTVAAGFLFFTFATNALLNSAEMLQWIVWINDFKAHHKGADSQIAIACTVYLLKLF